jgi:hypothetical protein
VVSVQGAANGLWLAMMCLGILVTSLAATVCLSMIAFYQPDPEKIYPVLATFGVGAALMLMAASQLDRQATSRHRDIE